MNDHSASMPPAPEKPESAEEVFARIQRRRGVLAATDADILRDGKRTTGQPDVAGEADDTDSSTRRLHRPPKDATRHAQNDLDHTETMTDRHHHSDDEASFRDDHSLVPLRMSESVWDDDEDYIDMDPGFPRSKTFQTLVRNPGLALAVAMPAAYLALRSAAIRRTAFQVGKFAAKQQLWKQVRRFTA